MTTYSCCVNMLPHGETNRSLWRQLPSKGSARALNVQDGVSGRELAQPGRAPCIRVLVNHVRAIQTLIGFMILAVLWSPRSNAKR